MTTKISIFRMATVAVFAAVMCVLGPYSFPIGVIPITFTNLVIYFAVILLGTGYGTLSYLIYFLLGFVGLPVFSAFSGGPQKILGPTGGYLIGFFFMALISGFFINTFYKKWILMLLGMVLGTAVAYIFGTAWFILSTDSTLAGALDLCVYPFIPADLAKIVLALLLGTVIRARLAKAGLLPAVKKEKNER